MSRSDSSFYSINPATGQKVWEGNADGPKEIDAAIAKSRDAFERWRKQPLERRIAFLNAFKQSLELKKDNLARIISTETGKPLWDSKTEVAAMIGKIAISIDAFAERCPEKIKEQTGAKNVTRHLPHGVVAVLGPYNFPGHLPNGHIVPALLAGNTVLFKPSELTPFVAQYIMECWKLANMPEGVVQCIQGGSKTGSYLAQSKGINGLFFTGSLPTGRKLLKDFADHPEKILALEMGGNNPLIVHNCTNIPGAVYTILQSAYITAGQRCTCTRRLIVTPGNETLIEQLKRAIPQLKIGAYTDAPEPFMGPVISEKAVHTLLDGQTKLMELGGKSLISMRHLKEGTGFVSPGLIDVTGIQAPDVEYFGPLLQLIRVDNLETAIKVANQTEYGLAAGILTDEREAYEKCLYSLEAGVINWNSTTTGASSAAPFGGIKGSGNFRPSAYYAADYCSYPVASTEKTHVDLPETLLPGVEFMKEKMQ